MHKKNVKLIEPRNKLNTCLDRLHHSIYQVSTIHLLRDNHKKCGMPNVPCDIVDT